MTVSEGKVVSVAYTLYTLSPGDDFEMVEEVNQEEPMLYLAGHSGLPPKFEEHLNGLAEGDTFAFEISAEDAFGEFHEENVVDFGLDMFKIEDGEIPEGFLQLGNVIPFTNDEGAKIQGVIHEILEDKVMINFNHPLAGKALKFDGKIVAVRDASAEEMDHGHAHGPGGHQH